MRIGGQHHAPAPLPQERPGTLCAQVWVGFGVNLDGYQKNLNTTSFWTPGHPAHSKLLYWLCCASCHCSHV